MNECCGAAVREHSAYLKALSENGCGDNSCQHPNKKRGGMGTNGGCRCMKQPELKPLLQAWLKALRDLQEGPVSPEQFNEKDK